jgi:hypothetical protein
MISVSVKTPLPATNTSVTGRRKRELVQQKVMRSPSGKSWDRILLPVPVSLSSSQVCPAGARSQADTARTGRKIRHAARGRRRPRIYLSAPFSLKNFSAPGCKYLTASGVIWAMDLAGVSCGASFHTAASSLVFAKMALTI